MTTIEKTKRGGRKLVVKSDMLDVDLSLERTADSKILRVVTMDGVDVGSLHTSIKEIIPKEYTPQQDKERECGC